MSEKRQKKWIKPRHKFGRWLVATFFLPHVKRKYGITIEKFDKASERPYLILLNHQTAYDQFLVGASFDCPVYYVATEDIFSLGFISKIINFFVAPIPIKKQTTDVRAVLNCKKIVKEGGTIAIMPEGNRTYSGQTEYINPAIAGLVKLLKLPVVFFRIEGGYGVHPRWSDEVRKGPMRAYVSRVMEVEEYEQLDEESLNEVIRQELFIDETKLDGEYFSDKLAEYLERVVYVCPHCGLSTFESNGDMIECKKCHTKVQYLPNKQLKGVDGEFPFVYFNDWYRYQENFIHHLDLASFGDKPMFADEKVGLFNVILYKTKEKISKNASITAYNDRLVVAYKNKTLTFPYEEASAVTVLGKNKLNVYFEGRVYQVKGDKRFNAVKYVNLYHHYKNEKEGKADGGFLGL